MLKTGGQLGRTQKAIIPESAARNETACTGEGILDQICERILSAGYLAREMANRLEYHREARPDQRGLGAPRTIARLSRRADRTGNHPHLSGRRSLPNTGAG